MPPDRPATTKTMSPQETNRQRPQGALFSRKAHFHVPSAEATFSLPKEDRLDADEMASAIVEQREQPEP